MYQTHQTKIRMSPNMVDIVKFSERVRYLFSVLIQIRGKGVASVTDVI